MRWQYSVRKNYEFTMSDRRTKNSDVSFLRVVRTHLGGLLVRECDVKKEKSVRPGVFGRGGISIIQITDVVFKVKIRAFIQGGK